MVTEEKETVECCLNCKSAYITEENGDLVCNKCYTHNQIEVLDSWEEYKEKYGHLWNMV